MPGVLTPFIEMLDHAVMYGPLGSAPTPGVGPGAPNFVNTSATLDSNIDPAQPDNGLGLRKGTTFSVTGRFEAIVPDEPREGYGIRLTDRNLPSNPTPQNPTNIGNDVVELTVRRDGNDGHLAVQFRYLDFIDNTAPVLLGEVPLNAATFAGQKIVLRLNHDTANTNDITAAFDLYDSNGNFLSTTAVPGIGHIFSDENWTHAQFIGSEPVENVSYLQGQYGALTIDQTGDWKYLLNNNQPNVQALAQGETVTDSFPVRVTDQFGAFDTKTVNVTVTGTNDAPVITSAVTVGSVTEDDPIHQSATGTLTATDVDHGAVLTWHVAHDAVNGNPGHVTTYRTTIDEFKIQKTISGTPTVIFDDTFTGTAPPTLLRANQATLVSTASSRMRTVARWRTICTRASASASAIRRSILPDCRPAASAIGPRSEPASIRRTADGIEDRHELHDQRYLRSHLVRSDLWNSPGEYQRRHSVCRQRGRRFQRQDGSGRAIRAVDADRLRQRRDDAARERSFESAAGRRPDPAATEP